MKKKLNILAFCLIIFCLTFSTVNASEVTGAISTGVSNSSTVTGVIKTAPNFDPEDGTEFSSSTDISLEATGSTAICYTTDNSTPSCSGSATCLTGTKYSSAIEITADTSFKAVACYNDGSEGPIAQASYEKKSSGGGGGGGGGGGSSSTVTVRSVNEPLELTSSQLGTYIQELDNGIKVYMEVPLGAVTDKTKITIQKTTFSAEDIPNFEDGAILIGDTLFSFKAVDSNGNNVEKFNKDVTIVITVPDLPKDTSDLGVYYYDATQNKWIEISNVVYDTAYNTVTFELSHFTVFAIVQGKPLVKDITPKPVTPPSELLDERTMHYNRIVNEAYYVFNHILLGRTTVDSLREQIYNNKAMQVLDGFDNLTNDQKQAIINFVAYSTETTWNLGEGERLGVLNSYLAAFGKLPRTQAEWQDVILIANGRWPAEEAPAAISKAKTQFEKVYLRVPDMNQPNDNAAVTIMAYGLRNANRNMESEKASIQIFKGIFKYAPTSATDWDTVRAIAYSGATR